MPSVFGTHKRKTKRQGRDFYEIIIAVDQIGDGSGGFKTLMKVTSRVRRHVAFWFDQNKKASHDIDIEYCLDGSPAVHRDKISTAGSQVSKPFQFSGRTVTYVKASGVAVKKAKVVKTFRLTNSVDRR